MRLLYAENFVYADGVKALVQLMREAKARGKGTVLYQTGVCAHQGSHAPAYDTPEKSGGGALFNKACHPLGPALYLKQVEGILRDGAPIRPVRVSAVVRQVLKQQSPAAGTHFRVMQRVDDFGRITVEFSDGTVADLLGHDLNISGIRNRFSAILDFAEFHLRMNPANEHELFLPDGAVAGDLLMREKLPTPQGTSFPRTSQFHAHGYVNEAEDAVACALEGARAPQSGPMLAWDTLAVLLAGYASSEEDSRFVSLEPYCARRFPKRFLPNPAAFGEVLQRHP